MTKIAPDQVFSQIFGHTSSKQKQEMLEIKILAIIRIMYILVKFAKEDNHCAPQDFFRNNIPHLSFDTSV